VQSYEETVANLALAARVSPRSRRPIGVLQGFREAMVVALAEETNISSF
jgi:hypothetical protein